MNHTGRGYIATVEAAYDLTGTTAEWLHAVGSAASPWLDRGLGVMLWAYDVSDPAHARFDYPVVVGCPDHFADCVVRAERLAEPSDITRTYHTPRSCETLYEACGCDQRDPILAKFRQVVPPGVLDYLAVKARSPEGKGVVLGASLPALTRLRPTERRTLSHIAAHLAAGYRLRRSLEDRALLQDDERIAAILSPNGCIEHATGDAKPALQRQRLRDHAMAMDRARSKHHDPVEALALWRALVDGRWSLVDRFDSDGRRYLVALRNDPAMKHPQALTLRERQVAGFAALGASNKLIAYDLGISSAAVSLHVRSALSKLGLSSRADLASLFMPHLTGSVGEPAS